MAKPLTLNDVMPIVDFINKEIDLENIKFQKIMKLIYVGVGLGYHMQEIDKKLDSYTTLIIEPELEIFRLSLFTTDYSLFNSGNRRLFLSIGDDKAKRELDIYRFYKHHDYHNYNVKYYSLLKNLSYIKDEITDFFENNYVLNFPYSIIIENIKRTISFINHKDRFLDVHKIVENDIIGPKKVLLISAGPSLDNYIELIRKYQNKFIVVCVDVIVRKLEKQGVVPDIIFSIDPSFLCARYLTTEDINYLKNSTIILMSQQHPDTMKLLRDRKLNYYFSQFANIVEEIGYLGSLPNVGTYSFQTMVSLGAKELYLIGNDAAFNQKTGSRYASDSTHTQQEQLKIDITNDNLISREDILEVKGNLQDTVKTNRSLLAFKYSYDNCINIIKNRFEYKAYNLSNGVYIDGLEPMTKDEFVKSIETYVKPDFDNKKNLDSISRVLESTCYKKDIEIINSIISRAKKFQKVKILSRDDFMTKKIDLMIWILERSKKMSIKLYGEIFLQYTSIIDAYINFAVNLKQNDLYTKQNLNQLSTDWAKGVVSVFKDMKNAIS
jgi:hypothetical protein